MPVDALDVVLRLQNLRAFQAGMAEASSSVRRFGAANQEAAAASREASAASGRFGIVTGLARKAIFGLGGAFAVAAFEGTKMSINFDRQMELVHTQAGASQKEVDKLKGSVLDLAKVTPQGPEELAKALFRIEGVGIRGKKAMSALKASADLAAVGNANVEDTAKSLAQAYFVGIKGAGSFHNVVAQLNATIGAGDMRLQQLTDALGTGFLASSKQAGLSMQDTTAALAVFGDETNNVSGWAAQFATALHFFTNPTNKATAALGALGLKSDQLAIDFHKPHGLATALGDLRSHLEKLPGGIHGVKANQVLGDILPGGRGRVMLVLLNQLDRLNGKYTQIKKTTGNFGDSIRKTHETAAYKIAQAWSRIQVDLIKLGHMLQPIAVAVVQFVAKALDWLSKLPHGIKMIILAIGGLGLAFAAGGPWGVAIAAVIAGVVLIVTHWKEIKKAIKPVVDWIVGAFHWIGKQLGLSGKDFSGWGKTIKTVFGVVIGYVKFVFAQWKWLWDNIFSKVVKVAIPIVVNSFKNGIHFLGGLIKFFSGLFTGNWKRMWNGIKQMASAAWHQLLNIGKAAIAPFKAIWDIISGVVKTVWGAITGTIKDAWNGIMHFFSGLPGKVANVFKTIWHTVGTMFKGALNWLIDIWDSLHFSIGGWTIHLPDPFPNISVPKVTVGMPHIPHLAMGGMILQSGTAVVGESGPELLHLPSGAAVEPLSGPNALRQPDGQLQPIHTHVYMDGKEIAVAIGKYTSKKLARR